MHDAVCPVGYVLTVGGHRVAYVTDLGMVTPGVRQNVLGCEAVILESNHDVEMLRTGTYPPELQARILSNTGHLSNADSAVFQAELVRGGTQHIILAHLSEANNTPALALRTAQDYFAQQALQPPHWLVAMPATPVTLEL